MTLQPYDSDKLDQLALRVLDLGLIFRQMGEKARQGTTSRLNLQDRKAQEWLTNLEHWARKVQADLEMALLKQRGAAKAQETPRKKSRGK